MRVLIFIAVFVCIGISATLIYSVFYIRTYGKFLFHRFFLLGEFFLSAGGLPSGGCGWWNNLTHCQYFSAICAK